MTDHVSRSEKKRQAKGIEEIARELAGLSPQEITELPVSPELRREISLACNLKGGALKRQIKYIAKALREDSLDDLLAFLDKKKGLKLRESQDFKQLMRLRDGIIRDALRTFDDSEEDGYSDPNMAWPSPHLDEAKTLFEELQVDDVRISTHRYAFTRKPVHRREIFRLLKAAMERGKFARNK